MVIMKHHKLTMSKREYPGGLRIIECEECAYAWVAEVNQYGAIRADTKIKINRGDLEASHSYIHAPQVESSQDIYDQILEDLAGDRLL